MMQTYIGTKVIKAQVMNLGDYNQHRGWTIPSDEDPLKEGYLVEYSDSYQSWSPKKQFEDAYELTENGADYAVRLHHEFGVLTHKIDKLKNFILSGSFENLPEVDRIDLREQFMYMDQYHQVLMRRVSRSCGNS